MELVCRQPAAIAWRRMEPECYHFYRRRVTRRKGSSSDGHPFEFHSGG
jgi:hypothetical protein